jgi:hypothetical protein
LMGGQACVFYGAAQSSRELAERARDREYWRPLRAELERLRHQRASEPPGGPD